jgi:hypothetical protein
VNWAAVEPTQGNYNETYLNIMNDQFVTGLAKRNIYTLVDSHQDVMSPQFCGWKGIDRTSDDTNKY